MPTRTLERQLRTYLMAERPSIFTLNELRTTFSGHPSISIEAALRRLMQRGEVARISRGRYAAVDPATSAPVAHPWAQAVAPFRTAAIAGYTALHHWELTTQIPHVIDVAVQRGVHHQPTYGALQRVRLITVPVAEWFGITSMWVSDGESVSIFARSRMVLDTFINPRRYGGVGNAMEVLQTARAMGIPLQELLDTARQSASSRARGRFAEGLRHIYGSDRAIGELVAGCLADAVHA